MKTLIQKLSLSILISCPLIFAGKESCLDNEFYSCLNDVAYPVPKGEWYAEGRAYSENGEDREQLKAVPLHEQEIARFRPQELICLDPNRKPGILDDTFKNFCEDLETRHPLKFYITNPRYNEYFYTLLQNTLQELAQSSHDSSTIDMVDALEACDKAWNAICVIAERANKSKQKTKYQYDVVGKNLIMYVPKTKEQRVLFQGTKMELGYTVSPDEKTVIVQDYLTNSSNSDCYTRSDLYLIDLKTGEKHLIEQSHLANATFSYQEGKKFTITFIRVNYGTFTNSYEIDTNGKPRLVSNRKPFYGVGMENQYNYLKYL